MAAPISSSGDEAEVSLLELADRLLARGVVINGDLVISVADVDLIYVSLRVLVSATEALVNPKPPGTPLLFSA